MINIREKVRNGLLEFHNNTNKNFINEGLYDKNILKVIFLVGGPGSGKSYMVRNLFGFDKIMKSTTMTGLKLVNSDVAFEKFIEKSGYNLKDLAKSDELFKLLTIGDDSPRNKAKSLTNKMSYFYESGRLGLIIDGTGKNFDKIKDNKEKLESLGYDSLMVFVNTSLETAMKRNYARQRTVPDDIVKNAWADIQHNIGAYQGLFKKNFIVVDNNDNEGDFNELYDSKIKEINAFLRAPIQNPIGKKWIIYQNNVRNKK